MRSKREDLIREIKLEKELAYRKKVNPLNFFKLMPMQARFDACIAKIKGLFGGNRSGKTQEGAKYVVSKCLAKPNQRWWACAETFNDSVNVQQRKVWQLVPKNRIKYGTYTEVNGFTNRKLIFDNGSIIIFKSYDQKRESFQSDDIDGCVAKGTLVALSDGSWKPIEEIQPGDSVVSMRNTLTPLSAKRYKTLESRNVKELRFNKVLWQRKTGTKKTLIFTCRGIKLQLTHDHRVFVSGKRWVKAEDIVIGDKVYFPSQMKNKENHRIKEHEAYWLGLMIGDGYIHKKRFQFTCLNESLIAEAKKHLSQFKNVRLRKKGDRQYYISQSKEFRQLFKQYGLIGTHAYDKFIPQDVFRSSEKVKRIFLRALYSCDGWMTSKTIGYATTSKRLAYDTLFLLTSLGFKAIINERESKVKEWRKQWYVLIHKCDHTLRFLDEIGIVRDIDKINQVKSECVRRMEKYGGKFSKNIRSLKSRKNSMRVAPIKLIEDGGEVDVYDIKVERDENFIANNICVHNCWNDEEPPYDIYKEQRMRLLDRDGEMIFTLTSLKGMTDLLHDIFEDHEILESQYAPLLKKKLPRVVEKAGMKFFMLWTTENPYITQSRVEFEAELLTKDEIKARIYGIPVNLSGRIYPSFNKDIHIIPYDMIPKSRVTLYEILDPHDAKPWAIAWIAVDKTGACYVVDEYPIEQNFNEMLYDDKAYDEYAELIHEKEAILLNIFGRRVSTRIIDPNYGNKTVKLAKRQGGQSKTTVSKELAKRGLKHKDGIDSIEAGHLKVREFLRWKKNDEGEFLIRPKLYIGDNCHNTARHVSRYSRKDITAADGDVKDKVKPREKYKDYNDLIRYFCMADPHYQDRQRRILVEDDEKRY